MTAEIRKYAVIALVGFAVLISLLSVIVCISDKIRAKKNKKRTPEAVLLLYSALGGALAMFLTMLLCRHKTRHAKFMIGLPAMILLHALIAYLIVT